jgi:hypothetical protein
MLLLKFFIKEKRKTHAYRLGTMLDKYFLEKYIDLWMGWKYF